MSWSRFDDGYDEHERIEDAWFAFPPNPVGLHVMATTACNRWQSDGVIRPRWLTARLPERKEREQVLKYMVDHQLFDLLPAGESREVADRNGVKVSVGPFEEDRYLVHDFLDRHDSSTRTKARRAADAERKRLGRQEESSGSPAGRPSGHRPDGGEDSAWSPHVRADASAGALPLPYPTRPDTSPTTEAASPQRARARGTSRSQAETVACPRCAAAVGEKCNGTRGAKRESCHLERHHLVGELLHIKPTKSEQAKERATAYRYEGPPAEIVAIHGEHFPDVEMSAVENAARMLAFRQRPLTPENLRPLIYGAAA